MTDPWAERRAVSEAHYADDPERYAGPESEFAAWVVGHLRQAGGVHTVVELGVGPGRDARRLVGDGFRVTTVDFASTAVDRALAARNALHEPFRSRWTVAEGEATAFLAALPAGRTDAIVAHLLYATFTPGELGAAWASVHRALRPGGLHLVGVRDRSDPNRRAGTAAGPGTRLGGPHPVAYRYFEVADVTALDGDRFDLIESRRFAPRHQLWVASRRRPEDGRGPGTPETPDTTNR